MTVHPDLPERLNVLSGWPCRWCGRVSRALRRVLGVNGAGDTKVGPVTLVCPSCDLVGDPDVG